MRPFLNIEMEMEKHQKNAGFKQHFLQQLSSSRIILTWKVAHNVSFTSKIKEVLSFLLRKVGCVIDFLSSLSPTSRVPCSHDMKRLRIPVRALLPRLE